MLTHKKNFLFLLLAAIFVYTPFITAQLDKNKEIAQKMIDAINDRDYDLLDEVIAPDLVRHCQATPNVNIKSLAEFKEFLNGDAKVFPDSHISTEMLIAEGDKVAGYFTYSGTQKGAMGPFPATGKKADLKYLGILRFEDGKIVEMWVEWDNMAFLTQLGHFPPPEKTEK